MREAGRSPPILFRADGSFHYGGVPSAVGLVGRDGMLKQIPPGAWAYGTTNNNTLTQTCPNGASLRVAIFVPDRSFAQGTPAAIVLKPYMLERIR